MVAVSTIKIHTKANIKTLIIKAITTKAIIIGITIHAEVTIKAIVTTTSEEEAMGEPEVITVAEVDQIIEVIITTNTISIMAMIMTTSQSNIAHCVLYVVDIITPPKHCFKGEHDINNIVEKMNINGHQSKQSSLYQ